jgi:hypothetical protein
MVVTMSWWTLWRLCSAADGEACGGRGLLTSWRAATSVALATAVGGGIIAILDKHSH